MKVGGALTEVITGAGGLELQGTAAYTLARGWLALAR